MNKEQHKTRWVCLNCGYEMNYPENKEPEYVCPECDADDWEEL